MDLRILAWDMAAVVSSFSFLFRNFCVCALRAGICMEVPRTTSGSRFSPSERSGDPNQVVRLV